MHRAILSQIEALFNRAPLDEILINGCHNMELLGSERQVQASLFVDDLSMIHSLQDLAYRQGVRLDPLQPAAGGLLEFGNQLCLRWHALLPPIARDGPLLSLRRHRLAQLRPEDFGDDEHLALLRQELSEDSALFIVGPTGAGKTSFLMCLLQALASEQRVAILEQTPEIPRLAPAWIRVCAQASDLSGQGAFTLQQVFDELLRLRPDRVVVGELRQQEAGVLRRSLLAGHGGVWCTLHAEGAAGLLLRLADLSGGTEEQWAGLLGLQKSLLVVMQRKRPRLREAWIFRNSRWDLIFSAKEK